MSDIERHRVDRRDRGEIAELCLCSTGTWARRIYARMIVKLDESICGEIAKVSAPASNKDFETINNQFADDRKLSLFASQGRSAGRLSGGSSIDRE